MQRLWGQRKDPAMPVQVYVSGSRLPSVRRREVQPRSMLRGFWIPGKAVSGLRRNRGAGLCLLSQFMG